MTNLSSAILNGSNISLSPEVSMVCVSNIFIRQMLFKVKGCKEIGHKHNFDHVTLLASGKLLVAIGEETSTFTAPAQIFINKDIEHKLIALEDNTLAFCIHGVRDLSVSEDIVSPDMIPKGNPSRILEKYLINNK